MCVWILQQKKRFRLERTRHLRCYHYSLLPLGRAATSVAYELTKKGQLVPGWFTNGRGVWSDVTIVVVSRMSCERKANLFWDIQWKRQFSWQTCCAISVLFSVILWEDCTLYGWHWKRGNNFSSILETVRYAVAVWAVYRGAWSNSTAFLSWQTYAVSVLFIATRLEGCNFSGWN